MSRLLSAFAVAAAFCVVACFVLAFASARKVGDEFVYVVADNSVDVGEPWIVRVGAIDDSGRPTDFVGSINGVAVNDAGIAVVDRAVRVTVDGVIDDGAFVVEFSVPVVAADAGYDVGAPQQRVDLVRGVHLGEAKLQTTRPQPGDAVVVEGAGSNLQLLVDGRAVPGLAVPLTAQRGALVVVSAGDSALPSTRVRTFSTFVGGPEAVGLDEKRLADVVPRRDAVGNVAPPLEAQRRQRQASASEDAGLWRGRLHLVDAALLIVVLLLAGVRGRQSPLWAVGAVGVVVALLAGLDAMLNFV